MMTREEMIHYAHEAAAGADHYGNSQVVEFLRSVYTLLEQDELEDVRYGEEISKEYGKTTQLVRCKECKYFEYDTVAKVDGIPLIVAHEICNRWGTGCKTSENGFCFLAELRGDEE